MAVSVSRPRSAAGRDLPGKMRGKMTVPADITQERIEALALADAKVMGFCEGKEIKRVVYVPRRLVNIVVEG